MFNIFLIFAQNIDFGCTLEPNLCFGAKKKEIIVHPCKPQFYYIKLGCKGVFITRTRFRDGMVRFPSYYSFIALMKLYNH